VGPVEGHFSDGASQRCESTSEGGSPNPQASGLFDAALDVPSNGYCVVKFKINTF